jgi:hypothetical protein
MFMTFAMLMTPDKPRLAVWPTVGHQGHNIQIPLNTKEFQSKQEFLEWSQDHASRMWDAYTEMLNERAQTLPVVRTRLGDDGRGGGL